MGKTKGFKVRVGVILPHQDGILMARQNDRPFWVFPGGTLEPGEDLETCAIREIQEEFNLTISIERLLYLADFIHPERQTVDVFFLGRYLSGTLQVTQEENINEGGFIDRQTFASLPVMPESVARQVLTDWDQGFSLVGGVYLGRYGPAA
jgi:8-oxo-dGTP diphosphatase